MAYDPDLIGLWHTGPYDLGAMETSEAAFLPDGGGWTEWSGFGGSTEVVGLRWDCPTPGRLVVQEVWYAHGYWSNDGPTRWEKFAFLDRPPEANAYSVNPAARIPGWNGRFTALALREHIAFSRGYALRRRDVGAADCPAYSLLIAPSPADLLRQAGDRGGWTPGGDGT
ncbi:hypothetical protein [Yinghuangia seranimata]|uniref:hypothetical protein n=1 Tax=Yinghuangia seranimata TaxID=408067 RepID=UPI00248B873D|nr:hypothetical protein [Yinghuangia seranimata]MDI2130328.1 hypothetical protein [Yinghuangia seranimata]